jgi:hypothetical protein
MQNLMDLLTGGGDPNKRSLLGFVGDLPGLLMPGSQAPIQDPNTSGLDPGQAAALNAQYKQNYGANLAGAISKGQGLPGASAMAGAGAQADYGDSVNKALTIADALRARREAAGRSKSLQQLIDSSPDLNPAQRGALSIASPDQAAEQVLKAAFPAKSGDRFSMTALGNNTALILDKNSGTYEKVQLPGEAGDFPKGTKLHFDTANNRVVAVTPDMNIHSVDLPEPDLPGGAAGEQVQYERMLSGQAPIGRQTAASARALTLGLAKYAHDKYGMDASDIAIHGLDAHAMTGALAMTYKQSAAMKTALSSMENNLNTAIEYAAKINTGAIPVNQILNWSARDLAANPARNQLQLAIRTVIGDWAKIISGSMGQGGSTDTAQHEAAADFGSGKYSALTLQALREVVRKDAAGKIAGMDATHKVLINSMHSHAPDTVGSDGFTDIEVP